jgi:predicted nuclease of predicted toxin-antitoxin system
MPPPSCGSEELSVSMVGEIGMSQTDDPEILAVSLERNAAVVTLDADFHTILAEGTIGDPSAHPGFERACHCDNHSRCA